MINTLWCCCHTIYGRFCCAPNVFFDTVHNSPLRPVFLNLVPGGPPDSPHFSSLPALNTLGIPKYCIKKIALRKSNILNEIESVVEYGWDGWMDLSVKVDRVQVKLSIIWKGFLVGKKISSKSFVHGTNKNICKVKTVIFCFLKRNNILIAYAL